MVFFSFTFVSHHPTLFLIDSVFSFSQVKSMDYVREV